MREITFDTETTGLDPKQGHRIIELGCVELIDKIKTGKFLHIYINPQRDVPKASTDIHGLTADFLSDKPKFSEIAQEFLDFIKKDKLVIHNASFDLKFINFELENINLPKINHTQAIDTLAIARQKFPGAKANLDALCKKFSIDLSKREKHGALLDAELLADVYFELSGGSQSFMQLEQKSNQDQKQKNITKHKKNRQARKFTITQDEIISHSNLIKKIKSPMWLT